MGLCSRFRYQKESGIFELLPPTANPDSQDIFSPSQGLLELCQAGALKILPSRSQAGRIVLNAEAQLINWHAVGVEAGTQYHVLVIEAALSIIRSEQGETPESLVLLVDTTGPLLATPPPLGALQSLVSLLQRAYPDRIFQIHVGPVNFAVRGLYSMVSRFMSKNSRHKIKLVSIRPKDGDLFGAPTVDRSTAGHVSESVEDAQCENRSGKIVLSADVLDEEGSTKASDTTTIYKDDSPAGSCKGGSEGDLSRDDVEKAHCTEAANGETKAAQMSSFSGGVDSKKASAVGQEGSYWSMFQCCCPPPEDDVELA